MKKVFEFLKKHHIGLIMILLALLRVWLGYALGGWYGMSETYDDVAMMQGLSLKRLIYPTNLALIKDLSFSLFLGFSAITNLPYTVVLSGYWVLTALVVYILVRKLVKNKYVGLFVFSYVLFLPIAFTSWGGLRIYRNAVIAPSIILTFSLALIFLVELAKKEAIKKLVRVAVLTGLVFTFTYFLKEDGIWLLACMIVMTLVYLGIIVFRFLKARKGKKKVEYKKFAILGLTCVLPLMILWVSGNIYRGINKAFFGVYEINTRTEGELGEFVEKIYKIESPNRSEVIWAPLDAIEAAFQASPTLGSYPKLLEEIKTTGFQGNDVVANPIKYDFLTWIMRSELADAGMWTTEAEVNDLFGRINDELDEAFKNGTLKTAEGRIQILASTGGYTWEEITRSNIVDQVVKSFEDSIWFTRYEIGFGEEDISYGTKDLEWDYTKVNRVLHMENDVNVIDKAGRKEAKTVVAIICWGYRIINIGIIVLVIVFIVREVVGVVRNWKERKKYFKKNAVGVSCAVVCLAFLGIAVVYSLATAWFFIAPYQGGIYHARSFVFYRVGVPALLTMSFIPAVCGWGRKKIS